MTEPGLEPPSPVMASRRTSLALSRSAVTSARTSLDLEDGSQPSLDELLKPAAGPGIVAVASSAGPHDFQPEDVKASAAAVGEAGTPAEQRRFPPWLIIGVWISLSTAVIFYNVRILRDYGFPYPITLTTLHLAFQTVATQLLARFTSVIPLRVNNSVPSPTNSRGAYLPLPNLTPTMTPYGSHAKPVNGALLSSKIRARMSSTDLTALASTASAEAPLPPNHVVPSTPPQSSRPWFKPRPVPRVSARVWWRRILPIAILFSLSLALSNAVYLYLSVAFIQMIKSASPIAVLITTFCWGLRPVSLRLIAIVVLISAGIGIASYGEVQFSWVGFAMQGCAILVEANRVVMIQMLLQGDSAMTPLESLLHFAPVCFLINAAMIFPLEGWVAIQAIPRLGPFIILTNAATTLLLNLSAVYLIQLSSLVLSLSKVGKDLILIFGSGLVLGTPITPLQWLGYGIALVGLIGYKLGA